MWGVNVTIKIPGLQRFIKALQPPVAAPIRAAYRQWGARARSFLWERFDTFSKGGGNWPALAASTMRQRRGAARHNKKKPRKFAILVDTGMMKAVLAPVFAGAPGAIQTDLKNGITIGFGGPGKHAAGGSATLADIASFHNEGAGHLPQRKIIVPPPGSVKSLMVADMQRALKKVQEG